MTIEELHDKAMEYTDLALISKQRGNSQESLIYFERRREHRYP